MRLKSLLSLDFTCCSSIGYRRMDKEELKKSLFDAIERLENNGLIDYHFRECYLLKEDSGPRFFFDLISNFSTDVGQLVKQMGKTLNQPIVDFSEMNELCIKLKGSAACIGACRTSALCSNLHHAIENKSKEGCLLVLNNIKHEFKNLQSRLNEILRVSNNKKHLISPSLRKILHEGRVRADFQNRLTTSYGGMVFLAYNVS